MRFLEGSQYFETPKSWSTLERLYAVFLFAILAHVVVNIRYLAAAPKDAREILFQTIIAGADGDSTRQLFYLACFCIVFTLAFLTRGKDAFFTIPTAYNVACIWALISFIWAIEPGIAFRRAIGMYVVLQTVCICIFCLDGQKTIRVVYLFMASALIASWISVVLSPIPLFSYALHPDNEVDAALIGAWRGVFMHKNVAGAVMTHASIIFFAYALSRKKLFDWLLFIAAIGFLVGTKSKTSLGLAGLVLMSGFCYRYIVALRGGNVLFGLLILFVLGSATLIGLADYDRIATYLSNPESLSGRVAIWTSLLTYIKGHLWLGSGYGSFWAIGYDSPIYSIATESFIMEIGHSHSGYFETILTTGLIGLMLAMIAVFVMPIIIFVNATPDKAPVFGMCFSIWMFGGLQNFTESQFFSPDKQSWIFVVIAIAIMYKLRSPQPLPPFLAPMAFGSAKFDRANP